MFSSIELRCEFSSKCDRNTRLFQVVLVLLGGFIKYTSPAPCYLMENSTVDGTLSLFLLNEKKKIGRMEKNKTKTTVWGHTNLNNRDILCQMSINV